METLDYLPGDEAGIKSVTLIFKGHNAYGYLKAEKGVHRLVRISPFDSSGRRHTSFVSCEVMPEFDETINIEVRTEDLKIDTYRASGAGGQHINTTDSAVRITHIPTNTVVTCQNERSQIKNKAQAMNMLKAKLYQREIEQQQAELDEIRGEQRKLAGAAKFVLMFSTRIPWLKITVPVRRPETWEQSWMGISICSLMRTCVQNYKISQSDRFPRSGFFMISF